MGRRATAITPARHERTRGHDQARQPDTAGISARRPGALAAQRLGTITRRTVTGTGSKDATNGGVSVAGQALHTELGAHESPPGGRRRRRPPRRSASPGRRHAWSRRYHLTRLTCERESKHAVCIGGVSSDRRPPAIHPNALWLCPGRPFEDVNAGDPAVLRVVV